MAFEAEATVAQTQTHEDLCLLLPFLLGLTGIDPSHTQPDPDENSLDLQSRNERIVLMNPFTRGMVVIGQALFQGGDQEKQGRPPASKAAIESMAVVEIEESEVGECAICLDEWKNDSGIVKEMPCKHRLHGDCIERWLGLHGSCPVCRFELPCDPENDEKENSGDGAERRIWVSLTFGGRNPDRSSSGDVDQTPSTAHSDTAS